LLGLYSLITVWAHSLMATPNTAVRPRTAAWYAKSHATFSDAIAAARRALWTPEDFSTSRRDAETMEISTQLLSLTLRSRAPQIEQE